MTKFLDKNLETPVDFHHHHFLPFYCEICLQRNAIKRCVPDVFILECTQCNAKTKLSQKQVQNNSFLKSLTNSQVADVLHLKCDSIENFDDKDWSLFVVQDGLDRLRANEDSINRILDRTKNYIRKIIDMQRKEHNYDSFADFVGLAECMNEAKLPKLKPDQKINTYCVQFWMIEKDINTIVFNPEFFKFSQFIKTQIIKTCLDGMKEIDTILFHIGIPLKHIKSFPYFYQRYQFYKEHITCTFDCEDYSKGKSLSPENCSFLNKNPPNEEINDENIHIDTTMDQIFKNGIIRTCDGKCRSMRSQAESRLQDHKKKVSKNFKIKHGKTKQTEQMIFDSDSPQIAKELSCGNVMFYEKRACSHLKNNGVELGFFQQFGPLDLSIQENSVRGDEINEPFSMVINNFFKDTDQIQQLCADKKTDDFRHQELIGKHLKLTNFEDEFLEVFTTYEVLDEAHKILKALEKYYKKQRKVKIQTLSLHDKLLFLSCAFVEGNIHQTILLNAYRIKQLESLIFECEEICFSFEFDKNAGNEILQKLEGISLFLDDLNQRKLEEISTYGASNAKKSAYHKKYNLLVSYIFPTYANGSDRNNNTEKYIKAKSANMKKERHIMLDQNRSCSIISGKNYKYWSCFIKIKEFVMNAKEHLKTMSEIINKENDIKKSEINKIFDWYKSKFTGELIEHRLVTPTIN